MRHILQVQRRWAEGEQKCQRRVAFGGFSICIFGQKMTLYQNSMYLVRGMIPAQMIAGPGAWMSDWLSHGTQLASGCVISNPLQAERSWNHRKGDTLASFPWEIKDGGGT